MGNSYVKDLGLYPNSQISRGQLTLCFYHFSGSKNYLSQDEAVKTLGEVSDAMNLKITQVERTMLVTNHLEEIEVGSKKIKGITLSGFKKLFKALKNLKNPSLLTASLEIELKSSTPSLTQHPTPPAFKSPVSGQLVNFPIPPAAPKNPRYNIRDFLDTYQAETKISWDKFSVDLYQSGCPWLNTKVANRLKLFYFGDIAAFRDKICPQTGEQNVVFFRELCYALDLDWFHSGHGTEYAISHLKGKYPGTFLLRASASDIGFALSFRSRQGVAHIKIKFSSYAFTAYDLCSRSLLGLVSHLIDYGVPNARKTEFFPISQILTEQGRLLSKNLLFYQNPHRKVVLLLLLFARKIPDSLFSKDHFPLDIFKIIVEDAYLWFPKGCPVF